MYELPANTSKKWLWDQNILSGMAKQRPTPRENLVRNLSRLMQDAGDNTVSLAAKANIPQRTIYNILHSAQKVSLEQADALARAYGYTGWQIILPDLPTNPQKLSQMMDGYLASDADTREILERIARKSADNG